MAEIPENYGGLGMNKITSTVLSENATKQGSARWKSRSLNWG